MDLRELSRTKPLRLHCPLSSFTGVHQYGSAVRPSRPCVLYKHRHRGEGKKIYKKAADGEFLPWNRIFKKSSGCNISVDVNPAPQPASKCSIRRVNCVRVGPLGRPRAFNANSILERFWTTCILLHTREKNASKALARRSKTALNAARAR